MADNIPQLSSDFRIREPSVLEAQNVLHWSQVVLLQVHSVISCMRRNARWRNALFQVTHSHGLMMMSSAAASPQPGESVSNSLSGKSDGSPGPGTENAQTDTTSPAGPLFFPEESEEESPLILSFSRLKELLEQVDDLSSMDICEVVDPFLRVIVSPNTTGPITGAALTSIEKLISYGLLNLSNKNVKLAGAKIIYAATHCKFEATDASTDEVVLLKILQVLKKCLTSEVGAYLGDKEVWECMETAFSMCFQMRLGELLRRSAETALIEMIQIVFSKMHERRSSIITPRTAVDPVGVEDKSLFDAPVSGTSGHNDDFVHINVPSSPQQVISSALNLHASRSGQNLPQSQFHLDKGYMKQAPFGDQFLKDFLKFLNGLFDTGDAKNTESMRIIGLNVLEHLLIVGGEMFKTRLSIRKVFEEDVIKSLLQLTRYSFLNYNMNLLSNSLRTTTLLFEIFGRDLYIHQEYYLIMLLREYESTLNISGSNFPVGTIKKNKKYVKRCTEYFVRYGCEWVKEDTDILDDVHKQAQADSIPVTELFTRTIKSNNGAKGDVVDPSSYSRKSTNNSIETRELILDTLHYFLRNSRDFLLFSFLRYDTDVEAIDIFEIIMVLLCKTLLIGGGYELEIQRLYFLRRNSNGDYTSGDENQNQDDSGDDFFGKSIEEPAGISPPGGFNLIRGSGAISLDLMVLFLNQISKTFLVLSKEDGAIDMKDLVTNTNEIKKSVDRIAHKKLILHSVALFNNVSAKECFAFLKKEKLLTAAESETEKYEDELTDYLFNAPGLDKKQLGEFMGKPANVKILNKFVDKFNWRGESLRIDEALRMLLEKFRLPGEAQQIQRVVEAFSRTFFEHQSSNKSEHTINFENTDVIFVLSYAIIMLNTDLHNPQVKRRMTKEDFRKNLRGTNNGKDFEKEYLDDIYEGIKNNEIIMPEEHSHLEVGLKYQEIQRKFNQKLSESGASPKDSEIRESLNNIDTNRIAFDRLLFMKIYKIFATSIIYTFHSSADDNQVILQKAIGAYYQLCSLAFYYGLYDVLDQLIEAILRTSRVTANSAPGRIAFIRNFSRNFKSQLSALVGFRVLNEFYSESLTLEKSWKQVHDILFTFYSNGLAPQELIKVVDINLTDYTLLNKIHLPLTTSAISPSKRNFQSGQNSLFSALSNFLMPSSSGSASGYSDNNDEDGDENSYLLDDPAYADIDESKFLDAEKSCADVVGELNLSTLLLEKSSSYGDKGFELLCDSVFAPVQDILEEKIGLSSLKPRYSRALFSIEILFKIFGGNLIDRCAQVKSLLKNLILDPILKARVVHYSLTKRIVINLLYLLKQTEDSEIGEIISETIELLSESLNETALSAKNENTKPKMKSFSKIPHGCSSYLVACAQCFSGGFSALLSHSLAANELDYFMNKIFPIFANSLSKTLAQLGDSNNSSVVGNKDIALFESVDSYYLTIERIVQAFSSNSTARINPQAFSATLDLLVNFVDTSAKLINSSVSIQGDFNSSQTTLIASSVAKNLSAATSSGYASGGSPTQQISVSLLQQYIDFFYSKAKMSLDLLYHLTILVPPWLEDDSDWNSYWMPLLSHIGTQCCHPSREIRQQAMNFLQKILLQPEFISPVKMEHVRYDKIFNSVLFPLLEDLVSKNTAEVEDSKSVNLDEVRSRACALLRTLFLKYVPHLIERLDSSAVDAIWGRILDILKEYYECGIKSKENALENHGLESDLVRFLMLFTNFRPILRTKF